MSFLNGSKAVTIREMSDVYRLVSEDLTNMWWSVSLKLELPEFVKISFGSNLSILVKVCEIEFLIKNKYDWYYNKEFIRRKLKREFYVQNAKEIYGY